jgi:hypothetical protein
MAGVGSQSRPVARLGVLGVLAVNTVLLGA